MSNEINPIPKTEKPVDTEKPGKPVDTERSGEPVFWNSVYKAAISTIVISLLHLVILSIYILFVAEPKLVLLEYVKKNYQPLVGMYSGIFLIFLISLLTSAFSFICDLFSTTVFMKGTSEYEEKIIIFRRVISWGSIIMLILLLVAVCLLFSRYEDEFKDLCNSKANLADNKTAGDKSAGSKLFTLFVMISTIFGAIGGLTYNINKVSIHSDDFDIKYLITYAIHPFLGAICGLLACFLLVLGQIVVASNETSQILSQFRPLIILAVTSVLAGFASQAFMKKLDGIATVLFSSEKDKTPPSTQNPSNSPAK